MEWKPIARIRTDYPSKFGIPRQSMLVESKAYIVFEPQYRSMEAIRGMEAYSHLWLLWEFSQVQGENWKATVRPPRLGGNQRVGVFATRSPFRPNPIGLSCVKLAGIEPGKKEGPVLVVTGADLMDGTPIYDIKPYLAYVDAHPEAKCGFADVVKEYCLEVEIAEVWMKKVPKDKQEVLRQILAQDPRPAYQEEPGRLYGMAYAGLEVKFQVSGGKLTVCRIEETKD